MLTWERIQQLGSTPLQELNTWVARRVLAKLGLVARWISRPEVIRIAGMETQGLGASAIPPTGWIDPPRLGQTIGECWIMLVNNQAGLSPLLRPCFVLPLRWCENVPHSRLLPQGLIALADQITAALGEERRVRERRWGLQPLPLSGFDHCDLSGIEIDCRSAWIPLSAGLILAADQIRPDPGVWSTGEWRAGQGIVDVGGLELKLDLADDFGARTIFLPTGQKAFGESWQARKAVALEIRSFSEGDGRGLAPAIREYLALSGTRPDISSALEVRVRYYLRQVDRNLSRRYYLDAILVELADYYRGQLPEDCHPTHLITIASSSPELVALLAKTLRARRCLILFTEDHESLMKQARGDVREIVPDCEVTPGEIRRDDRMPEDIKNHVDQFTKSIDPSRVLFDLTPGAKDMSLELAISIAPPSSYLFYLRHDFDPQLKRAIPGMKPPLVRKVL